MKSVLLVIFFSGILFTSNFVSAYQIPYWVRDTSGFWCDGLVSDHSYIETIQYLIDQGIVVVPQTSSDGYGTKKIPLWIKNTACWWADGLLSDTEFVLGLQFLIKEGIIVIEKSTQIDPTQFCAGTASCFVGSVTEIIDGDTIKVDGKSIRFSLVNTPEYGEYGYVEARKFIERICQVGSSAIVDEDDLQTQGSYGRMIAVIYCNGENLNEAVLEQGLATLSSYFCSKSEFSSEAWAQKYGCAPKTQEVKPSKQSSCDTSYPDVCIPPYPPDLDCGEISYTNFKVLPPDPHNFDGDKDGIGCEKSTSQSSAPVQPETKGNNCDPSYPTVCIPSPPPDLDCKDIQYRNFKVLPPDPHRFDGDKDGIGCES